MMMTITNAIRRSEMITPTTASTAPEPPAPESPSLLLFEFEVLATDDVVTV